MNTLYCCSPGAPLPSSNLVPFWRWWRARGREHCRGKPGREQQHVQAYRGTRYRASKHQIRRGQRAARSSTSQGSAEPWRTRIKSANREVSEGKADSDHGIYSSYDGQQGAANGQGNCGVFSAMNRALDGWMLARAPASPPQCLHRHGPRYYILLIFY